MSPDPAQHEPDVVDAAFSYLDRAMDGLHDRVLRPILLAGRYLAYGLLLVLVGLVLVIALVIAVLRFSTIYLFAHHVWITYLVISALSTSVGLLIWRKRRPVSLRKP